MVHQNADLRVEELGLILPEAPEPVASYVTMVQFGDLGYTSGHGPVRLDGSSVVGKVGLDLTVDAAQDAARLTALNILSTIRTHLGSLNRVTRVIKVLGLVNATPDFAEHPVVINGCSDLLVAVFGDIGRHARSAVGVGSLPGNIPVEIEVILGIRELEAPPSSS